MRREKVNCHHTLQKLLAKGDNERKREKNNRSEIIEKI